MFFSVFFASMGLLLDLYFTEHCVFFVVSLVLKHSLHCFYLFFFSLKPVSHVGNPWFKEYWEQLFHCTFNEQLFLRHRDKVELCTGNETMDETTGRYITLVTIDEANMKVSRSYR